MSTHCPIRSAHRARRRRRRTPLLFIVLGAGTFAGLLMLIAHLALGVAP